VLAVLLAGLPIADRTAKTAREGTSDWVERYEQRFIPLRRELPSGAILGYVSDSLADDDARAYFMAQYALAPVVLTRDLREGHLILGNFVSGRVDPNLLRGLGLILARDFGNGVVLLRLDPERQGRKSGD